ncbi:MAG: molybdate ABC transporter permease subunit [Nitrospirota bacterium]|nr:molybdate ABC transporter permease subunit [Nitrospirota bacterium]
MESSTLFSLRLSLQVAAVATILIFAAGVPIAYLLARGVFRGREVVDVLITLPLVLPPTVTGYLLIVLLGRNGIIGGTLYRWTGWSIMFTWQAAVIASFVVALPLMVKTARAAIETVDRNLIDASATLGHSELWTVVRVTLPLAQRGIVAGLVLAFARALGEFGATLMLAGNIPGRTDTMPIAMYAAAASGDRSGANVMVLLFTAISGACLYAANRLGRRTA